ncbi:MAG: tetratricopeptide repeat protein [Alphaproteobacteria bacterium]|nr:tetratricopeptide repeat protein [Alphaproteobacteria bacterium]
MVRLASYDGRSMFGGFSFGDQENLIAGRMGTAAFYEKKGRYDRAIREYDQLLKFLPGRSDILMARALDKLKLRRYDDAIADYSTVVHGASGGALGDALSARCFARAVAGKDFPAALADCNKAIDISPDNEDAYTSRGFLHFRMVDLAAASTDLDQAVSLSPRDADALYLRGLVKRAQGDKAGGDADIATATTIESQIAETYSVFGVNP